MSTFLKACATPLIAALASTCVVRLSLQTAHAAAHSCDDALAENVYLMTLALDAISLFGLVALCQAPRLDLGANSNLELFQS
jgi:hypothetical protein